MPSRRLCGSVYSSHLKDQVSYALSASAGSRANQDLPLICRIPSVAREKSRPSRGAVAGFLQQTRTQEKYYLPRSIGGSSVFRMDRWSAPGHQRDHLQTAVHSAKAEELLERSQHEEGG
jgi:hypothetical protein